MLTDEQIEALLYEYAERQDEFSLFVISVIANRLSKVADFDKMSSLGNLSAMQKDISEIEEEYQIYRDDQKKRIKRHFWNLSEFLYGEALIYYETQLALRENRELVRAINEAITEAQNAFNTLTENPVIVMRDLSNPTTLKPYSLDQAYRSAVNEALNYRNLSDELSDIALKRTETQLFDSGVRYMREDSSDNPDSVVSGNPAVRMNLLDSIKKLINKVQDVMGKQFGSDGMELSAHVYPAPDHAPAQGHQYTNENVDRMQSGSDFEDVDGNYYVGFVRRIGEWNCRHYFMKIKIGKSKPTYTQEQLDKILEDNERGYTAPNGKHYTLYECTQVQRRYEREIRKAKEKYLYAKELNDKVAMYSARTRVGSLTTQYKQFSRACDISAKLERIRVKGY